MAHSEWLNVILFPTYQPTSIEFDFQLCQCETITLVISLKLFNWTISFDKLINIIDCLTLSMPHFLNLVDQLWSTYSNTIDYDLPYIFKQCRMQFEHCQSWKHCRWLILINIVDLYWLNQIKQCRIQSTLSIYFDLINLNNVDWRHY